MIDIVGIRYRNYTHYTSYKSCLPIYGIAIIFHFLMILKEMLTFVLLSHPVLLDLKAIENYAD